MNASLATLLALVLLVAPILAAAQQQPPVPDGGAPAPSLVVRGHGLEGPAAAGRPQQAFVVLNNTGTAPIVVTAWWLYADGAYVGDQTATTSQTSMIPSGGEKRFAVGFTPPDARAGPQRIVTRIAGPDNATILRVEDDLFVKRVAIQVGFTTEFTPRIAPGGWGYAQIFVENAGNANDTPTLSAASSSGFNVLLPWANVSLGPGERRLAYVVVNTTMTTEGGALSGTIGAVSSIFPSATASAALPPIEVSGEPLARSRSLRLAAPNASLQVFPNESLPQTYAIANPGDVSDVFRAVARLSSPVEGWSVSLDGATTVRAGGPQNETFVAVPKNATAALNLTVVAPATPPPPGLQVVLEVASANAALLARYHAPANFSSTSSLSLLPPSARPSIEINRFPDRVYANETLALNLTIRNEGRLGISSAPLSLKLRSAHGVDHSADRVESVPPLGSTTIEWIVPAGKVAGDKNLTLTLSSSANATVPAVLSAFQEFRVRGKGVGVESPASVPLDPGERAYLTSARDGILVVNPNDDAENYTITLRGGAPWLDRNWTIEAPPRSSIPLPLVIDVPADAVGAHEATIVAALASRSGVSATATTRYVVTDSAPPVLDAAKEVAMRVGVSTRIAVQARDASPIAKVVAKVTTPSGGLLEIPLSESAVAGTYEGSFLPTASGEHKVAYEATDDRTPPNVARVTDVRWLAQARYGGVRPAFDAERPVSGARLLLEEAEPGATQRIVVAVDGRPLDSATIEAIDVSGLPDGALAFEVRAFSKTGEAATTRFNVTLDRVPPLVGKVEFSDPAPGKKSVTVRASDATGAAIETHDGRKWTRTPLDARSQGSFSATLAWPALVEARVLAWDAAGNEARIDVTEQAGARRNEAPAAGWPALALALAVAAFLARRARIR